MTNVIPLQNELLEAYDRADITHEKIIQTWSTTLTTLQPLFEKLAQKEMSIEISEKVNGKFYLNKKPATVDNIKLALMASILICGTNQDLLDDENVVESLQNFFTACCCLYGGDTIPVFEINDYIENVVFADAEKCFLSALEMSFNGIDDKCQSKDFSTYIFISINNTFYALKERLR